MELAGDESCQAQAEGLRRRSR